MKVYADQFLDDSEKALYVQNIALKWRSFTDPVGRGQSAEMMSEQDLQDYDIPLNLENVGPNALEWLLKNLNSHPASCSLLPVHLDAPFLERVLQSDNCSWAMPRFWEVAKTRVVNPLAQEPLPFSNISPKVLARLKGVRERSSNVKEKRAEMNLLAKSTAGEARRVLLSRLNSASDDGELNSLTLLASNFMNNLRFGSYKYPVIWEGRPGVWESAFQIWTYRKTSNFDWASSLDLQIRYFTAPENWKEIQEKIL